MTAEKAPLSKAQYEDILQGILEGIEISKAVKYRRLAPRNESSPALQGFLAGVELAIEEGINELASRLPEESETRRQVMRWNSTALIQAAAIHEQDVLRKK